LNKLLIGLRFVILLVIDFHASIYSDMFKKQIQTEFKYEMRLLLYRYSVLSQIKTSDDLSFLWGLSSKALSHAVSTNEYVLCIFCNPAACVCGSVPIK
jgi:hypothetical protein